MRLQLLYIGVFLGAATLAPASEVTGRVVSERKGVVGATISALPYETRYAIALRETKGVPAPAAITTVSSSGDGRFKLVVPPTAPTFVVRVSFGGLSPRTLPGVFEKPDVDETGDVVLGRGESVSGRVVDASGKPVAMAQVRRGPDGVPTSTNKDGLFRFDDVEERGPRVFAAANRSLSVTAPGFEAQAAAEKLSGTPFTVRLKPTTAHVTGLLKEWSGKPATNAVVRVVGDAVTRWVRTDAAGKFDIQGPPLKKGRIQALGLDGSSLETALPATPSANAATFTLQRPASIEGRITRSDTGRFVPSVKVEARTGGTNLVVRSSTDGRYKISGLPEGSYRVSFDEKTFVALDRREVELAAGEAKILDVALTPAVTLVGRVSDERGQPIAGARGTLSPASASAMDLAFRALSRVGDPNGGASAFVSGPDGTFKATRLAPGSNQQLSVVHPDFERREMPGIDLVAGAPKPLSVDVVLSPGFVLSGVVKDKEGRPLAGAQVVVNRSVQMMGGRGGAMVSFNSIESIRPQVETDFEGKFGFKGLAAADYDVIVTKAGFTRSATNGVKAGKGTSSMEVTLNPGASISGRVVQPNGQPVTGYSISARPSAGSGSTARGGLMGGRANNMAPTDPDGSFLIEGLIPGTAYDLSLFGVADFTGDARKKNLVAPATDVEIEVPTRGRIAGRVLDAASSAPITEFEAAYTPARSGGMVMIVRGGSGDNDRRTPFSSNDGSFAFEDVPPGNWDVTVSAKTYQDARTGGVSVVSGETRNIDVKASRGLVIRGRVVDGKTGRGVQDASVSARNAGSGGGGGVFVIGPGGGDDGGVITDADGRFEISGKGAGSYQLTARQSSYTEGTARVTLDDRDGAVDIPLSGGGTIAGVVMSSQGAPLAGAQVSVQNSGDGGMRFGFDTQGSLTDAAGRFRIEHLSAGRYKVGASMRTESSTSIDVALNAGDIREDLKLSLDAGATLRGVVTGLPDSERGGLMIGAQGGQDYFANTRTNADGSFAFSGVPKGTVTLRATAGDLITGSSQTATKEVIVAEGQAEVTTEIVFSDGLSISGTVMRRGVPVVGARIAAFMSGTGRQASSRSDESGAFRIVGLEAGRVNVTAFAEGFSSQVSQIVELTADTSIELVIPVGRLSGLVVDEASGLPLESTVELQRTTPATTGGAGGLMRLNTTTDSSGRFTFADLEPVDYKITARRSGYESLTQTTKPNEAGEDVRLALKRGSGLSIEARDAQMGFGLRSLFVRVQEGTNDAFTGPVTLDADGKGEIPGLPPGSYAVNAQTPGYAPVHIPNVMAPSTVLRLAFTPGGAVEFRTTEEFLASGAKNGQLISLSGSQIGMGGAGPNPFRLSRLTQRMENLAPGSYRLTLEGGLDKTFDITEGGLAVVTIP
ncbi:MAG: carboxypeptidase-like regulatory domain-containing protein [Vicinamibacteria bacterium]